MPDTPTVKPETRMLIDGVLVDADSGATFANGCLRQVGALGQVPYRRLAGPPPRTALPVVAAAVANVNSGTSADDLSTRSMMTSSNWMDRRQRRLSKNRKSR